MHLTKAVAAVCLGAMSLMKPECQGIAGAQQYQPSVVAKTFDPDTPFTNLPGDFPEKMLKHNGPMYKKVLEDSPPTYFSAYRTIINSFKEDYDLRQKLGGAKVSPESLEYFIRNGNAFSAMNIADYPKKYTTGAWSVTPDGQPVGDISKAYKSATSDIKLVQVTCLDYAEDGKECRVTPNGFINADMERPVNEKPSKKFKGTEHKYFVTLAKVSSLADKNGLDNYAAELHSIKVLQGAMV